MKITSAKPLFVLAVCSAMLAFAASSASAANYCVGAVPACTGSPQPDYSFDRDGLLAAITAANNNPGADNVHIAEGTIEVTQQLNISSMAGQELQVLGAGPDKTRFRSAANNISVLYFNAAATTVSGISVEIYGSPSQVIGVNVGQGTLRDFKVSEVVGGAVNFRGVSVHAGGKLRDGLVSSMSTTSTGIVAQTGDAAVANVELSGGGNGNGVNASTSGSVVLDRMRIAHYSYGAHIDGGSLTVTNSLIDMGSRSNARGISAHNGNNGASPIALTVARSTIVGRGTNQRALFFGADSPNESFTGSFDDVLLYGTASGFEAARCVGGGGPIDAEFGKWASNGVLNPMDGCTVGAGERLNVAPYGPGFRNFDSGDYRLRGDSPVIDQGTTSPSGEVDLLGGARQVDGDGDGNVAVDIGAFEYQRSAPVVELTADKTAAALGESVSFSAEASDADGETLTFSWKIDDVAQPGTGSTLAHAFAASGTHSAEVTVTDEVGESSSAAVAVTVAAPIQEPGPGGGAGGAGDPVPSAAPRAKLTTKAKRAFTRGTKGFSIKSKQQKTFFTVTFTNTTSAEFKLQSVGKKKQLKAIKGVQRLKVGNGTQKFAFGGKFAGKKLKAGSYRVTITPLGAAGKAGRPVSLTVKLR